MLLREHGSDRESELAATQCRDIGRTAGKSFVQLHGLLGRRIIQVEERLKLRVTVAHTAVVQP